MSSILDRPVAVRSIGTRAHAASGPAPAPSQPRRSAGSTRSRLAPRRPREDHVILFATFALVGIGVLEVFSSSAMNFLNTPAGPYATGVRQLLYALIGIGAMLLLSELDYRIWRRLALPGLGVAIALLIAVVLPGVVTDRDLNRSLVLGPISIHAAEVAKLALVLFLADHLSRRGHALDDARGTLLPALLALSVCAGLVLVEPDLGTAVVIGLTGFTLLFVGGLPLRWLFPLGLAGALLGAASIALRSYQSARLVGFLDRMW